MPGVEDPDKGADQKRRKAFHIPVCHFSESLNPFLTVELKCSSAGVEQYISWRALLLEIKVKETERYHAEELTLNRLNDYMTFLKQWLIEMNMQRIIPWLCRGTVSKVISHNVYCFNFPILSTPSSVGNTFQIKAQRYLLYGSCLALNGRLKSKFLVKSKTIKFWFIRYDLKWNTYLNTVLCRLGM